MGRTSGPSPSRAVSRCARRTSRPRGTVGFKLADVQGKGVVLGAGDEVEFVVVPGAQGAGQWGELLARCVARTKEARKTITELKGRAARLRGAGDVAVATENIF